jgi:hypothetical protein
MAYSRYVVNDVVEPMEQVIRPLEDAHHCEARGARVQRINVMTRGWMWMLYPGHVVINFDKYGRSPNRYGFDVFSVGGDGLSDDDSFRQGAQTLANVLDLSVSFDGGIYSPEGKVEENGEG